MSTPRTRLTIRLLAVCAGGVLQILCFPPYDMGLLGWVVLVPLLVALDGVTPAAAFALGLVNGVVASTGVFIWIWTLPAFNELDYLLLAAFFSAWTGLFGAGLVWVRIRTAAPMWLVAPPLWTALEYLRAHAGFLSAPWMLLGHSQSLHLELLQLVSVTGVYGLSFLLVLANAAAADVLTYAASRLRDHAALPTSIRPPLAAPIMAALMISGAWLYGHAILNQLGDGPAIRVAVIQGNIPQDRKWDQTYRRTTLEQYARLTREAAAAKPALVIWPETAMPGDVTQDGELRTFVSRLAGETGTYLLVGSAQSAKFSQPTGKIPGHLFNTMVLVGPDGRFHGVYKKRELVPFGEYEPLAQIIRWPTAVARVRNRVVPGEEATVLTVGPSAFAAPICWESIFPDPVREFVVNGARFLVNGTNEAWFGISAAPYQFLAMSVFRAAEHRVPVVRAANTGISAIIDPHGRIVQRIGVAGRSDLFTEGILVGAIPLSGARTFYTRVGELFAWIQIGLSLSLMLWAWCPAATRPVQTGPRVLASSGGDVL